MEQRAKEELRFYLIMTIQEEPVHDFAPLILGMPSGDSVLPVFNREELAEEFLESTLHLGSILVWEFDADLFLRKLIALILSGAAQYVVEDPPTEGPEALVDAVKRGDSSIYSINNATKAMAQYLNERLPKEY